MLARATDRVVESVAGGVSLSVVATHPHSMAPGHPVIAMAHTMSVGYWKWLKCVPVRSLNSRWQA